VHAASNVSHAIGRIVPDSHAGGLPMMNQAKARTKHTITECQKSTIAGDAEPISISKNEKFLFVVVIASVVASSFVCMDERTQIGRQAIRIEHLMYAAQAGAEMGI
jgi:hypothetical protein